MAIFCQYGVKHYPINQSNNQKYLWITFCGCLITPGHSESVDARSTT